VTPCLACLFRSLQPFAASLTHLSLRRRRIIWWAAPHSVAKRPRPSTVEPRNNVRDATLCVPHRHVFDAQTVSRTLRFIAGTLLLRRSRTNGCIGGASHSVVFAHKFALLFVSPPMNRNVPPMATRSASMPHAGHAFSFMCLSRIDFALSRPSRAPKKRDAVSPGLFAIISRIAIASALRISASISSKHSRKGAIGGTLGFWDGPSVGPCSAVSHSLSFVMLSPLLLERLSRGVTLAYFTQNANLSTAWTWSAR